MDVNIIHLDDSLACVVPAIELEHTEESFSLFAKIPADTPLMAGDAIGFMCVDGRFRLFEITQREMVEPEAVWEINAVEKAVRELLDEPVTDLRANGIPIRTYAERLIQDTRFSIGTCTSTHTGKTNAYYESVWASLEDAMKAFDVYIIPYYTFTDGLVTGRYIDIVDTLGADRGRIFELGDDMSGIRVQYDDSNVKTALFGRGKGVEIEGESNTVSYGRRTTFSSVEWDTSDGDPADKPLGQEYVVDPDALAAFGRDGRNRFGFAVFDDITDPDLLLQKTWELLQLQKEPALSISASIYDTERILGRSHEAVRLGDPVLVRIKKRNLDIRANVTSIVRDYIKPEATQIVIDNASAVTANTSAGKIISNFAELLDDWQGKSGVWDRSNAFDINGAIDVVNNQIISTLGHWYTDETGAIMLVSADGTKAMRLTGAGWQIADSKTGDVWNWRTAATGTGIVADEITTGTLQASLIKILGSSVFYWDSANIFIIDPNNINNQIRIGQYDGVHYGIGFTNDGGTTWTTAMNFNGLNISATGFAVVYVQMADPDDGVNVLSKGDIWVESNKDTLWSALALMTWGDVDNKTWGDYIGAVDPKTYVWDGSAWELIMDAPLVASMRTELTQTEAEIALKASQSEVDNLASTVATNTSNITVNANAITAEVTRATTAEGTLTSTIAQDKSSWQATFKSMGADGYTKTGITTIGASGITVTHSSASNCKTEMSANGFRIMNSSNTVLGGLMSLNGSVVTAMQSLYNPSYSNFVCDIGSFTGDYDTSYGLTFKYGGTTYGNIGIGTISGSPSSLEITSANKGINIASRGGSIYIHSTTGAINLDGYSATIESQNDITFVFTYQGVQRTMTAGEIWSRLD